MPTPVVRHNPTVPADEHSSITRAVLTDFGNCDRDFISYAELETLFIKFVQDDNNIQLCKAVETLWLKMGMRP